MKPLLSWLSRPYYFNPSLKFKVKFSVLFGLFVFVFLYIFKPFTLSSLEEILLNYTLILGIGTTLGVFFTLYIPPLLFKNYFDEDNWTIGRNLFLIIIGTLFLGFILWCCGYVYKKPYKIQHIKLIDFIAYTFLVGLFPLLFFIFTNEKNIRRKRTKKAREINRYKRKKEIKKSLKPEVIIYSDNKKEKIVLKTKDLVYISSQGNYASFFIKKNTDLKEKILRVTLLKINEELEEYTNIIRCHKSYIVNVNYISDISGNARGYLLKSEEIPFDIPVSRSFSKQSLKSLLE